MNKSEDENLNVYEDLFIRYFESLCSFVYSYIPDMESAKDIVQDTFVALWKNRDRYQPSNTLLYTIARNKCLDHIKTNQRERGSKGLSVDLFANLLQAGPEEEPGWQETVDEIWKYAETLPAQCKRIFVMSQRDNLKNKEIAALLDISVKAVEKQTTKARSLIRKHLLRNGISPAISFFLLFF